MTDRIYPFRYLVEPWNKAAPSVGKRWRPGINITDDHHGYTDRLFVVSIMNEGDPEESILLLDSTDGPNPSRELLEKIKAAIEHHIREHT